MDLRLSGELDSELRESSNPACSVLPIDAGDHENSTRAGKAIDLDSSVDPAEAGELAT
jgi:hypothetical protein